MYTAEEQRGVNIMDSAKPMEVLPEEPELSEHAEEKKESPKNGRHEIGIE